jgi:hypothetical protein
MTCKSGAQTLDGSKSLNIKEDSSATSKKLIDVLMLMETKMLKDKL